MSPVQESTASREPAGRAGTRPARRVQPAHARLDLVLWRSLFPLAALALLAGTALWGPWVTLVLTVAWWLAVRRIG